MGGHVNLDAAVLPAIADTVARFRDSAGPPPAVLDGVEMDLAPPCYETFAELVVYCEHVASAVGLACIHVWGFRGPEAFPFGRAAGIAMQLTNILRDLKEDARSGRIYPPAKTFAIAAIQPAPSNAVKPARHFTA